MWGRVPSPLGGAAFPLSSVGWCCLVSSSFGRCCAPPLFSWVLLHLLLLEAVLFFHPFRCCLPSPPLGGATFHGWFGSPLRFYPAGHARKASRSRNDPRENLTHDTVATSINNVQQCQRRLAGAGFELPTWIDWSCASKHLRRRRVMGWLATEGIGEA